MKRLLFIFLALPNVLCGMEDFDKSIIKNASYVAYENSDKFLGEASAKSEYVIFYTYDGNPIEKVEHRHFRFDLFTAKLDPGAPKPQPASYAIKYWNGCRIGFGLTKGAPGYFILFYDKNGNEIERHRYDMEGRMPSAYLNDNDKNTYQDLDLTIVKGTEPTSIELKQKHHTSHFTWSARKFLFCLALTNYIAKSAVLAVCGLCCYYLYKAIFGHQGKKDDLRETDTDNEDNKSDDPLNLQVYPA